METKELKQKYTCAVCKTSMEFHMPTTIEQYKVDWNCEGCGQEMSVTSPVVELPREEKSNDN